MRNSPYLDRPLRSEREVKKDRWPWTCDLCDSDPCRRPLSHKIREAADPKIPGDPRDLVDLPADDPRVKFENAMRRTLDEFLGEHDISRFDLTLILANIIGHFLHRVMPPVSPDIDEHLDRINRVIHLASRQDGSIGRAKR